MCCIEETCTPFQSTEDDEHYEVHCGLEALLGEDVVRYLTDTNRYQEVMDNIRGCDRICQALIAYSLREE